MFIQNKYQAPELTIVGAGGIGSNLVYNMYRDRTFFSRAVSRIVLYDGDLVEPKNLVRQNFTEEDIGLNKAVAIANKYPELSIDAVQGYFEPSGEIGEGIGVFDLMSSSDIIVCGVDNITTRIDIIDKMLSIYSGNGELPLWIDAGNETYHGNVLILGDYDLLCNYRDILVDKLEEDDAPYNRSCADVQEEDEGFLQIYDVNMLAALYTSILLKKIITTDAVELYQNVKGVQFGQLNTKLFDMNQQLELLQRETLNV